MSRLLILAAAFYAAVTIINHLNPGPGEADVRGQASGQLPACGPWWPSTEGCRSRSWLRQVAELAAGGGGLLDVPEASDAESAPLGVACE